MSPLSLLQNIKLCDDRTTLYGDLQRTFGSDWHKKWQGNVGINWQF